jgi:hypothetical protein
MHNPKLVPRLIVSTVALVLFLIAVSLLGACTALGPPGEETSSSRAFESATERISTVAGEVVKLGETIEEARRAAEEAKRASDQAPGATEIAGISAAITAGAGVLLNAWRNARKSKELPELAAAVKRELNGTA